MVVHQSVFAALWATVHVLMGVCWPAWRMRGAVWRSVRAMLVIEWRGECAGMGPWERERRENFFETVTCKECGYRKKLRKGNHDGG